MDSRFGSEAAFCGQLPPPAATFHRRGGPRAPRPLARVDSVHYVLGLRLRGGSLRYLMVWKQPPALHPAARLSGVTGCLLLSSSPGIRVTILLRLLVVSPQNYLRELVLSSCNGVWRLSGMISCSHSVTFNHFNSCSTFWFASCHGVPGVTQSIVIDMFICSAAWLGTFPGYPSSRPPRCSHGVSDERTYGEHCRHPASCAAPPSSSSLRPPACRRQGWRKHRCAPRKLHHRR